METINNLIQQTKEEISILDDKSKKYPQDHAITFHAWLEATAKLSALQTAQDIFIKILDEEFKFRGRYVDAEEIKQKLLGEKNGNNK